MLCLLLNALSQRHPSRFLNHTPTKEGAVNWSCQPLTALPKSWGVKYTGRATGVGVKQTEEGGGGAEGCFNQKIKTKNIQILMRNVIIYETFEATALNRN